MPDTSTPIPLTFEAALAELETILRELEDGTTTLDDALLRYERGIALLRHCYTQLHHAEQRIQLLAGTTDDGMVDLKPFDHVAAFESTQRGLRKTSQPGCFQADATPGTAVSPPRAGFFE
ncbi:MAG: exodeoxyribonuclease VII small subunit [Gemmataceae bacterium]|nr:exodeoxyribonuclease VII small subunit [Gemmata sp.]MDW8197669.1 exodeoxyribonuclease VII small subunit [Gemmataceae bacterium]